VGLAEEAPVKIEEGWVRAVPPFVLDSAAFFTVVNNSDQALRLTGGSTPIAESAQLMTVSKKVIDGRDILDMKAVEQLPIPAHGRLILGSKGDRLVLKGLRSHPRPGNKVELTLHFEPGNKKISTELPVVLK
jgi:hypothetical protein